MNLSFYGEKKLFFCKNPLKNGEQHRTQRILWLCNWTEVDSDDRPKSCCVCVAVLCYGNWHPARLKWVISFLATWDQWKVVPASERYWVDFNYLQEPRCLPVNMVGLIPCLFIPFRFNLCRPQNYWFRWQLPYSIESPLRPVSQTPHSTKDQRHCGPIDLPQVWLISRSNRVHQGFVWELCIFNIKEGIDMNY